ncbi:MAG TPA: glycosyltransferase family 1 protein [Chthoniobacterales bacterium]|jgi:glycosyltransferase involved in cell wall biosynthesis
MVLLLGNYPPDQQQSMQRFSTMMLDGLTARGIETELFCPQPRLGNFHLLGRFVSKWLGYIDKYIFFPSQLRKRVASRSQVVVHICDHSNAVYVNNCAPASVVVTCHDLLAVRGGLGEDTDCPATLTGRFLQRWILRGLGRAAAIVCDSTATASDARRLLRKDGSEWIKVVLLGLNYPYKKLSTDTVRSRLAGFPSLDLDRPFVVHVGSNLRRKNRDGALRIVARVKDKWSGQIVFAGEPLDRELREMADGLGIADRIVEIGNPTNEVLEALYNSAAALLYPSRFEGFGWPVIEAQACGCPVICSTSGPLPEVAGDAGLFHAVEDEAGFATDLVRLTDPAERARWSEKGLANAKRFSTPKMVDEYVAIYRQLGAKL